MEEVVLLTSQKVIKYLDKYQERNYAPKKRKVEKSDLGKYRYRDSRREAERSSGSDCILEGREEPVEEKKEEVNGTKKRSYKAIFYSDAETSPKQKRTSKRSSKVKRVKKTGKQKKTAT